MRCPTPMPARLGLVRPVRAVVDVGLECFGDFVAHFRHAWKRRGSPRPQADPLRRPSDPTAAATGMRESSLSAANR